MTITVVDGNNLESVMADAGIEAPPADKPSDKPEAKTDAKPEEGAKTETTDPDDVEDDEGITPRQRKEMTANMLKAIGKKHRRLKEAEEFAAHTVTEKSAAEARAKELELQLKEAQARLNPPKESIEPKREDFKTDDDFIEARADWKADQKIAERERERKAEERHASVRAQFQRAAELIPDFESTVQKELSAYTRPTMQGVVSYMRESDMFAELGYHFAKNPDVLEKLDRLSGVRQLVELGKIEARLAPFGSSDSSSKAGEKPDNGKADKPSPSTADTGFSPSKARSDAPVIKPLTSGEGASVEPEVREMSTRQMIEKFQRDQKVNLHARKRH